MEELRKLLWPFSPLYAAAVWLRNKCYDWGIFDSLAFEIPVLCVGNLSVGGTGKTPMVEWLLRYFQDQKRVAVLSRGYRRQGKGYALVRPTANVSEVGDEPLQLARKFPWASVAVDANRRRGIQRLIESEKPELIILDDGFQHRRVQPSHSILLTAWDALYPDQRYLPYGDLRDHKSQAGRADLVVVTKCPRVPSEAERARISQKLALEPQQQLAFATLHYTDLLDRQGKSQPLEKLGASPFTLVTGIANPEPLLSKLREEGLRFEHLRFPDHHAFSSGELKRLRDTRRILTTEKDAVRLGDHLEEYWTIGISHRFAPEDSAVLEAFLNTL